MEPRRRLRGKDEALARRPRQQLGRSPRVSDYARMSPEPEPLTPLPAPSESRESEPQLLQLLGVPGSGESATGSSPSQAVEDAEPSEEAAEGMSEGDVVEVLVSEEPSVPFEDLQEDETECRAPGVPDDAAGELGPSSADSTPATPVAAAPAEQAVSAGWMQDVQVLACDGPLEEPEKVLDAPSPVGPGRVSPPPKPSVGRWSCRDFPFCTAHCPFLFLFLTLAATGTLVALLWPGLVVNSDTSVFLEADSRSSVIRAAFLGALPFRDQQRRLMTGPMPPIDTRDMYKMDHLELYYSTTDPGGLLQPATLAAIRNFELDLRDGPMYQRACHELSTEGLGTMCDPGHSVINAAYPSGSENVSDDVPYLDMRMDGRGPMRLRDDVIMKILTSKKDYQDLILPKNFEAGAPLERARSFLGFNFLCCRIEEPAAVRSASLEKARGEWSKLIAQEVLPKLVTFQQTGPVRLNFDGGGVSTMQLWGVLQSDALFAIGSVGFIISYLTMHSGSLLLSCGSMLLTMLAIPAAFVFTATVSGSNEVTGTAFLSVFLIAGLSADVVLVFNNFWQISKQDTTLDSAQRVCYVYRNAGLACLGTTLTTAASFFANLASVLRTLREFGFFMGMCIIGAYLYLLVGMPALLILNDRCPQRKCCRRSGCLDRLSGFKPSKLLFRYRRCFFAFFLLLVVGGGAWTASVARLDVGVPQMFPDGHNLNDIEDVTSKFEEPVERWTADDLRFCNFNLHEDRSDFLRCTLHQCQITLEYEDLQVFGSIGENGTECQCFPSEYPSRQCQTNTDEGVVMVRFRVVGEVSEDILTAWRRTGAFQDLALEAAREANPMYWRELGAAMSNAFFQWQPEGGSHALQQEYWETGEIFTTRYQVLPSYVIPLHLNGSSQLCASDRLCYCGAPVCTYAGRRLVDPVMPNLTWSSLSLPAPGRLLRRLSGTVDVALVWGLRAVETTPLLGKLEKAWHFEEAFRIEAPATQRTLYAACSLGQKHPGMLVTSSECWVEEFRNYVARQGYPFPVPSALLPSVLARFVDGRVLGNGILAKDYMWLDEDLRLKATYVQFYVGLNYMTARSSSILKVLREWDKVVDDINRDAPSELGSTWHTSSVWIRAEAELAIVDSTVLTMVVSGICGFTGALCFTHLDLLLSLMVVLNVVGVTICLAWFMIVLMGWAVGVLEVLGLIVFVGYSITYSLHIAHKYREHTMSSSGSLWERRTAAVQHALRSMSGSIMGSAITTLGSSFFLFFCQLVIFVKLATVLFSVTFFACLFATWALPAALLCVGPVGLGCELKPVAFEAQAVRHVRAAPTSSKRLAQKIPLEGRGEVFGAPALAPKRLTGLSSTAVTVL